MSVDATLRRLPSSLAAVGVVLFLLHLSTFPAILFVKNAGGYVDAFNLAAERNVPTAFSAGLFLIQAACAALLYRRRRDRDALAPAWLAVAGTSVFLSADEWFMIHEAIGPVVRDAGSLSGWFYRAWIVPYLLGVGVLGAVVLPALFRLQRRPRAWLLLGATAFVGGAVGVEAFAGRYYESEGTTLFYIGLQTLEESLELTGLIVALKGWQLALTGDARPPDA